MQFLNCLLFTIHQIVAFSCRKFQANRRHTSPTCASLLAGLWSDRLGGALWTEKADGRVVLSTWVAWSLGVWSMWCLRDLLQAGWISRCWAKVVSTMLYTELATEHRIGWFCLYMVPVEDILDSFPCISICRGVCCTAFLNISEAFSIF